MAESRPTENEGYVLLDSGDGVKIERLGAVVVARPSTWCIWKRNNKHSSDVIYEPKKDSGPGLEGWNKELAPWPVTFHSLGVQMEARLQRNGQIGIFPEHASYLPQLAQLLEKSSGAKVLNLFAFTGLASMVALKHGAEVTHVDILKPVLDWAARNAELNGFERGKLRLIPDEALSFLAREVRRGNKYDVIILDPPSFSRIAKGKDWELDSILRDLITNCLSVLSPKGSIFFTCHHGELAGAIVENLIRELENDLNPTQLFSTSLGITESDRIRTIPAGFLTFFQR